MQGTVPRTQDCRFKVTPTVAGCNFGSSFLRNKIIKISILLKGLKRGLQGGWRKWSSCHRDPVPYVTLLFLKKNKFEICIRNIFQFWYKRYCVVEWSADYTEMLMVVGSNLSWSLFLFAKFSCFKNQNFHSAKLSCCKKQTFIL